MGGNKAFVEKNMQVLQVAFTYMGTVVGAGFATGQEILQFFTRFGNLAALTILLTTIFICWLGTKIMLLANEIQAACPTKTSTAISSATGPAAGSASSRC